MITIAYAKNAWMDTNQIKLTNVFNVHPIVNSVISKINVTFVKMVIT